ncbi:MAG TPA: hypothetical protein PKD90_11225, partial [Phnomibacter sp.]|nr:hypothetical protein [Phnomibacter sp.]
MKLLICFLCLLVGLQNTTAQKPAKQNFSIEPMYGANINFWVNNYDETPGPFFTNAFYKKNLIGSAGGLNFLVNISKKS